MPEGETLANFAATGATLALHLSVQNLATVVAELAPVYGADCPVAVVYRASWPDERILRGTLADIEARMEPQITRTALILVGPALAGEGFDESCLYAPDYDRRYRPQSASSPWGVQVGPGLYRPGLPPRRLRAALVQSRQLGDGRGAALGHRRAGGGRRFLRRRGFDGAL